jgi:hypothetical protein
MSQFVTPRRTLLAALGLLAAMVVLIGTYLFFVIASPYASEPVPASCSTSVSHIPATAQYDIPGVGSGVLLTEDSTTAVAITANYGQTPLTVDGYIVSKNRRSVLRHLSLANAELAAAIHGGTVYLFNDKIGYWTDAGTGQPINYFVESDNYRGIYTSGSARYVQTDFVISSLGAGPSAVFNLHLPLAVIAYGCVVA